MDRKAAGRADLIAKVAQSLAVVLGVTVATYEILLKDRDQERQVMELTLKQIERGQDEKVQAARDRLRDLHDQAYATPVEEKTDGADFLMRQKVSAAFDDETRDLARFYNLIWRCIQGGFCDRGLTLALVCDDARADFDLVAELDGRIGAKMFNPTYFLGLDHLSRNCPDTKLIDLPARPDAAKL
jgi:hypothetical protein